MITPAARRVLQLRYAALLLVLKTSDRIVHREFAVLNGWVIDRHPAVLVHIPQHARESGGQEQAQTTEEQRPRIHIVNYAFKMQNKSTCFG